MIILSGAFIKSNSVVAYELLLGGILYIILCIIIVKLFINRKYSIQSLIKADNFLLFAIAYSYATQGISNITDTDIPRLKSIIRGVYYIYLIFWFYMSFSPNNAQKSLITTILAFTSFPFSWLYVIGDVQAIPLSIGVVALLLDKKLFSKMKLNYFEIFILVMPVFILTGLLLHDYYNTTTYMARFFLAIVLFLLAKIEKKWILGNLYIFLILHLLFFSFGYINNIINQFQIHFIFHKRDFVSGINTNDIAAYLLLFIAPLLGQFQDTKNRQKKIMYLLFFIYAIVFIFLLQAKTTISLLTIFLLVYFLLKKFNKKMTAIIILITVFVNLFFLVLYVDYKSTRVLKTFHDRRFLWEQATEAIKQKPVLGWGGDNWMVLSSVRSSRDITRLTKHQEYFMENALVHSHNTILQLWMDSGIFFVLSFTGFWLYALSGIFRQKNIKHFSMNLGLVSLFLYFGNSLLNYTLFHFPILFSFFIILAIPDFLNSRKQYILQDKIFLVLSVLIIVFFSTQLLSLYFYNKAKNGLQYEVNTLGYIELGKNKRDLAKNLKYASFAAALTRDTKPEQLHGEILYHKLHRKKELQIFKKAESSYRYCADHSASPGFCYYRLRRLYLFQGMKKKANIAKNNARKNDPFAIFRNQEL